MSESGMSRKIVLLNCKLKCAVGALEGLLHWDKEEEDSFKDVIRAILDQLEEKEEG